MNEDWRHAERLFIKQGITAGVFWVCGKRSISHSSGTYTAEVSLNLVYNGLFILASSAYRKAPRSIK
jgi:hypothetical protein